MYMITLQCLAAHFDKLMILFEGSHSMEIPALEGRKLPST